MPIDAIIAKHVSALILELQASGRDGVPGTGFATAQADLRTHVHQWVQTTMPLDTGASAAPKI